MIIRLAGLNDLPSIAKIERTCFTLPFTEENLYQQLTGSRQSRLYLAESEGEIIGHLGCWLQADEVKITTLAVRPDRRRQGIASALLSQLIKLQRGLRNYISLEVRLSNIPAQNFYKKIGFKLSGKKLSYYRDNNETALIMCYRLSDSAEVQSSVSQTTVKETA